MVKDTFSHTFSPDTARKVSLILAGAQAFVVTTAKSAHARFLQLFQGVLRWTGAHSDITTVVLGVVLLCLALFGLWFKILTSTGI